MFQSIGFHAALVLNRLRNERRINECNREDEERSRKRDEEEQQARKELAFVNKRLAELAARVEPLTPGGRKRGGN